MALRARNPAVGCAPSGGREGGREPERRWGLPGAAARGQKGVRATRSEVADDGGRVGAAHGRVGATQDLGEMVSGQASK